jgi:ParB family transcriptional regulator, chromosome partitioning protein
MSESEKQVQTPEASQQKVNSKQPRGLGRGLANLLSSTITVQAEDGLRVRLLPLDAISAHKRQPRSNFETQALEELARSIREHGVLQPILVSEIKDAGAYKIIAGERRYRAAQMVGLKQIPAIVRDPLSPGVSYELALIENIQRADLTAIEEAKAYQVLLEEYKLSHEELAKRIGKDRVTISNMLRLLKLHPEVTQALDAQKITVGHAKVLCGIEFEKQPYFLKTLLEKKLSVRGLELLLNLGKQHPKTEKTNKNQQLIQLDPQYLKASRAAEELLSMKIEIVPSQKDKGKVVFHYHNLEALTELFDIFEIK